MISALLGIFGVFIGALLTQALTKSAEWRTQRLEAMVEVAAASGRVVSAHERMHELFIGGSALPLSDDRVVLALKERGDAHTAWRSGRARLEILIVDDLDLYAAMNDFERYRIMGTKWVTAYLKNGDRFLHNDYKDVDNESWNGMRAARYRLMECARHRSKRDSQWNGHLRLLFARKQTITPVGMRSNEQLPFGP